ncbi:MAG: hypothetical protein O2780_17800 [Proteobacteria bacterium]|jgi:hypothetical protein|nr:hypothetical protein [Pseudomonadota bacterium]MDA1301850.1 hypothetical protein [Pseudomonadota bacterium]
MSPQQNPNLQKLMQNSGLWRASSIDRELQSGISSGFDVLDRELPGAGWPADGVTELLYDTPGIGEFRLLAPALARLSRSQSRRIVLISPPYIPYPPALHALGIDLDALLVVRPGNGRDMLWAMEQALGSKGCSVVLAWANRTPGRKRSTGQAQQKGPGNGLEKGLENGLSDKQIRRLQVASKEGRSWHILFRPAAAARVHSPAELRIHLGPDTGGAINLKILKRRGGWETDVIRVNFNDGLNQPTPDFTKLFIPSLKRNHVISNQARRPLDRPVFPATADRNLHPE